MFSLPSHLKTELIGYLFPSQTFPTSLLFSFYSPSWLMATHIPKGTDSKPCHHLRLNHCQLSLSISKPSLFHLLLGTPTTNAFPPRFTSSSPFNIFSTLWQE